ncbi:helix-hairpin-helix domain-containing protein [Christensenellaceae bacterium OttesenSCG-928-K19]|nr:helix-hairpin-helix domain-containing protein [Christensenellaceae bacterium OttesenSCG-928-K19]
MLKTMEADVGRSLREIPGIGRDMERHLNDLGFATVESLAGQDAEEMYRRECIMKDEHVDRCVLYVYRLAVYYAENETHDPQKLKWWNWKD